MTPISKLDAACSFLGWSFDVARETKKEEIDRYFTQEHLAAMFGEDADISDWPWTLEEIAAAVWETAYAYPIATKAPESF